MKKFWSFSKLAVMVAVSMIAVLLSPAVSGAQAADTGSERTGEEQPENPPPPLDLEESPDRPETAPAEDDGREPGGEFSNTPGVPEAPQPAPFAMPSLDGASEPLSAVLPRLDSAAKAGIAQQLDVSVSELASMASNTGLRVDQDGIPLYEDPAVEGAAVAQSDAAVSEPGPFPNSQTFLLHSRPGANRVIYLDFTGHSVTGTAWRGGATVTSGAWYGASVSQSEVDFIQDVWQRVAEDYAPFNVDVTTQYPGLAAITRSSVGDTTYGTRVVITPGPWSTYNVCSSACGGVAYVGTYDWYAAPGHAYYQPAWVHAGSLSQDAKNVAEASSHEAGHNLGLSHDGNAGTSYYAGHNLWAPIMGNSYNRPVSQWSKGEYAGANQTQDDFVIMQANGLVYRPDDHPDSLSTAAQNLIVSTNAGVTNTVNGVIDDRNDQDAFEYIGDCAGGNAVFFYANNAPVSPNLDIQLRHYSLPLSLLATANPAAAYVSRDVASGMDAALGRFIADGQTIYNYVDGVGVGSASTGYTDYASLGQYSIYAYETAPGNDNFPGFALAGPSSPYTGALNAVGTNCGATKTTSEPIAVGGTVWYNWTAPKSGKVAVSTCDAGTNFDTYVQVYTGASQGALTAVADNNNGPAAWCTDTDHSRIVSMSVTAGTNYKIRVRGWSGDKGDFKLSIKYHWCVTGTSGVYNYWVPTIIGTPNAETLTGTPGSDTILAYGGDDVLHGLGGNDRMCGGHGDDVLNGGDGIDYLSGDVGNDSINGGNDNDRMYGGSGNDAMDGWNGADQMYGQNGNDSMLGWSGDDRMYGGSGVDNIQGEADNDKLFGNEDGDTMSGGSGDDRLAGGNGDDVMYGDVGNDTMFGQNQDDKMYGGDGDDKLYGNPGLDVMEGNAGNDVLRGASGADDMDGGAGIDLLAGGSEADTMRGGDGNDQMYGNSGNDNIAGQNGDDIIGGQAGNDTMNGGANYDICAGGTGTDTATLCESTSGLPGPVPAWAAEDPTGRD